jgi:peptidoglycan/xylan/chitin deacetylase (PgdA/CDA1 family)
MNTQATSRRQSSMLPILMYHGLHADLHAHGRYDPVYSVRPDDFARQLDWLLGNGYHTVRLGDQARTDDAASRPDARPVAITFDDGDVSNVEVALPLLAERGMTAEFFITSDFIGQEGMVNAADVRALAAAGMGIGAHGRSHGFLEDMDIDELDAELSDSRACLAAISGQRIDAVALPGGRGGERERRAALALGYRHLLGSVPGPNRDIQPDEWWQRLAVTRDTTPAAFAALVAWQGLRPRIARARFLALALPKRVLGNAGYERLRARLL